jgi:hypothetical protein
MSNIAWPEEYLAILAEALGKESVEPADCVPYVLVEYRCHTDAETALGRLFDALGIKYTGRLTMEKLWTDFCDRVVAVAPYALILRRSV